MHFYDEFEAIGVSSCACDSRCNDMEPTESNPTGCTNCDN